MKRPKTTIVLSVLFAFLSVWDTLLLPDWFPLTTEVFNRNPCSHTREASLYQRELIPIESHNKICHLNLFAHT